MAYNYGAAAAQEEEEAAAKMKCLRARHQLSFNFYPKRKWNSS
jgi:hypothetical protein